MSHRWECTHQARAHQKPKTDSHVSGVTVPGSQVQVSPREMAVPEVHRRECSDISVDYHRRILVGDAHHSACPALS